MNEKLKKKILGIAFFTIGFVVFIVPLLQGDVGSGKTIVALMAIFLVSCIAFQVPLNLHNDLEIT